MTAVPVGFDRRATALALLTGMALATGLVLDAAMAAQTVEQRIFVSVVDRNGTPVAGLGTEDFLVREDGVAREVLRVTPAGTEMQIAVLVDTSQAATDAVRDIRVGVQRFVEAMLEGNQLSLITFGGPPRILVESTNSAVSLRAGIGRLFGESGSAAYLLDALVETAGGFERRGAERPVIVVVATSGLDFSNADAARVLERLEASGASLHPMVLTVGQDTVETDVAFDGARLRDRQFQRDLALEQGSSATGGRRRDLITSTGFEDALMTLASQLSNQYLVVYGRPDALIPPERVDVSVRRADATARARRFAKG